MLVVIRLPLREGRVTPAIGLEPCGPCAGDVANLLSDWITYVLHLIALCRLVLGYNPLSMQLLQTQ